MFGLSKQEKRDKLSREIARHLRMLIVHVMEGEEVPSNIKYSLYVMGCFTKICSKYHYISVNGRTNELESTRFTIDTISLVLQVDPQNIQDLLFLGFSNKEPTFIEGMEDGGKWFDNLTDLQQEPTAKIYRRIKGIANSLGFE